MMVRHRVLTACTLLSALAFAAPAPANVLFSEDFNVDHTANWTVNPSTGVNATDTFTDFFFDYSTVGIPAAPGGSTTRGLKMYANHTAGIFGGLTTSPTGQSFAGDYVLRFSMWLNYNGAASPGNGIGAGASTIPGGSGTTQLAQFGVLTAGTATQWFGGVQDSLSFVVSHDGGSGQDYRVYPKSTTQATFASGYFAATSNTPNDVRNDTNAYYADLGELSAPAAQLSLYPQQFGTTRDGAAGFAWRDIVVTKAGNTVTWSLDGRLIATVPLSSITGSFGGGNFFLGHSDSNATSSTDPNDANLLFTLYDNVSVVAIPEAHAWMFGAMAATVGSFAAWRRRRAA